MGDGTQVSHSMHALVLAFTIWMAMKTLIHQLGTMFNTKENDFKKFAILKKGIGIMQSE